MITKLEHNKLLEAIDKLLVEGGEVHNRTARGKFTTKQVLERAGIPNTRLNWNYVLHVLKIHYPMSKWETGSRDNGYNLRIKTLIR